MVRPTFFDCVTSDSVVGNTIEHFFRLDGLSGKLGQREFVLLSDKMVKEKEIQDPYSLKRCLSDIIKVICYLSVIIPATFLVAKAFYRHSHTFNIIAPVAKEPSLTSEDISRIAAEVPQVDDADSLLNPFLKDVRENSPVMPVDWHDVDERRRLFAENVKTTYEFMQKPFEQDVIAITIGHGDRDDQMWPKPVVDEIFRNKSVLNLLFERERSLVARDIWTRLYNGEVQNESLLLSRLHHVQVKQFGAAFPKSDVFAEECVLGNWQLNQVREFQAHFTKNVEQALASGKKIYLGYHTDCRPKGFLLDLYNRLKVLFPNQIYLLIGHAEVSTIPVSTIKAEQMEYVAAYENRNKATHKKFTGILNFFPDMRAATI